MRIQDVLKFSLELVLPERLVGALQKGTHDGAAQQPSANAAGDVALDDAQSIIEELDHGEFGGPSFGPETMQLMAQALHEIRTELPQGASDEDLRKLAAAILKAAADGERDSARLKSKARDAVSAGATPTAEA